MKQLLALMKEVIEDGEPMEYRKGQVRYTKFGALARFDLRHGRLPVMTTRKPLLKGAIGELLWFLKGSTNVDELKKLSGFDSKIWDDWANDEGEIGPLYGRQWTNFGATSDRPGINQLERLVKSLRENPISTGHIVSAWDPAVQPDPRKTYAENIAAGKGALSPCHTLFQVHVRPIPVHERTVHHLLTVTRKHGRHSPEHMAALREFSSEELDSIGVPRLELSLQLYQRSCDLPIGGPVNILSYSLLAHMLAHVTGMAAGEFIWTLGNYHIYREHVNLVQAQLEREPYPSPRVWLNPEVKELGDFTASDIRIASFVHHDALDYRVVS